MPAMIVWPVSSSWCGLEGRVLLGELLDRGAELLLVALGLRLDGHAGCTGSGKVIDSSTTWSRVAQGVAGRGVLEADDRVRCGPRCLVDGFSLLACIWKSLPMRSFLPLVELTTCAPGSTCRSRRGRR